MWQQNNWELNRGARAEQESLYRRLYFSIKNSETGNLRRLLGYELSLYIDRRSFCGTFVCKSIFRCRKVGKNEYRTKNRTEFGKRQKQTKTRSAFQTARCTHIVVFPFRCRRFFRSSLGAYGCRYARPFPRCRRALLRSPIGYRLAAF